MSEISVIVEKLNQPPFGKKLSLVSFDDLAPYELVELLNEVFAYLDPSQHDVDIREEAKRQEGATSTRMADFLKVLKYPIPRNIQEFKNDLEAGERSAIYPILHFILSRLDALKTRAYLARYLVGVEIPSAFLHDEAIQEVYQEYKALQAEFKEAHKAVQSVDRKNINASDLRKEISQLEDEKSQLLKKISNLEKKTDGIKGFAELYEVTSSLRHEQEEEAKLQDQAREQQAALELADRKLHEMRLRFDEMSAAQNDDSPVELVRRLEREVESNRRKLDLELPRELDACYAKMRSIEQDLNEPMKTQYDVEDLEDRIAAIRDETDRTHEELNRARRLGGGDDKLKMFRQQSAMVQKKLLDQQDEHDRARQELKMAEEELASMQDRAKSRDSGGSKTMSKRDFNEYAKTLRGKTSDYKTKKKELEALRSETVVLNRTESILRSRSENVEEVLKNLEREKGVEGARDMATNLEQVSKKAAQLNMNKKMTLEEISEIVRQLRDALAKRKVSLAPQIQKLRTVRETFQEIEQEYLEKKSIYENTAVGLETEKIKLENECNAYQSECIREESKFHLTTAKIQLATAQLNKYQDEQGFLKGDGRLLRDFQSYKDLYRQKIQQQEQLTKELRKKQKSLKENADSSSIQRQIFVDLKRLLELKVNLKIREFQAHENAASDYDVGHDMGGANIMTIDQEF